MQDPKPCPFCGSLPRFVPMGWLECSNTDCSRIGPYSSQTEKAVADWNPIGNWRERSEGAESLEAEAKRAVQSCRIAFKPARNRPERAEEALQWVAEAETRPVQGIPWCSLCEKPADQPRSNCPVRGSGQDPRGLVRLRASSVPPDSPIFGPGRTLQPGGI